MPTQRLTTQRQLYHAWETTEGQEVYGANTSALQVTNLVVGPDVDFYTRAFVGQMGGFKGNIGAQSNPMLSFTVEARGGAATSSIVPSIDLLLKSVLSPRIEDTPQSGVGTTVQNGGGSQTIWVVDATGYSNGNAAAFETSVADNYEVGWIANTETPVGLQHKIILTQPLTFAPALNAKVRPSATYKPQPSGHGSLSFQMYLDSANAVSFLGCKGTMKFDAFAPGLPPTLTFNWKAINWQDEAHANPTPSYDSATPPIPYKFKIDNNPFDVKLATWSLRQTIARKRSQNSTYGTFAEIVTDRDLRGLIQAYNVDDTQWSGATGWTSGTEIEVSHQFGNTRYNMVAYQIPKAQRVALAYGDDNGLTTDFIGFEGNIVSGADEIRLAFL